MIKSSVATALFLTLLPIGLPTAAGEEIPVVRVGIVVDGPWEGNDYVRELTRQEIVTLTEGEFEVIFPDEFYLEGDWSLGKAVANLGRLLGDDRVDLVIAWGVLASHAICCMVDLPQPVIAPVILDIDLQSVPFEDGVSGVKNLSYVALPNTLAEELRHFREVFPFDNVALLANRAILEAIPEMEQRMQQTLAGTGLGFSLVPVGFSAEEALQAIPAGTEATFMYPQLQLDPVERRRLTDGLTERGLLSFTALGQQFVEEGLLAGLGSTDFFPRMARRIALNAQRILLGEDAGAIPVHIQLRERLTINMRTARTLGVSPTYEAMLEANVLHAEELEGARKLTLVEAVREAIEQNLDLRALDRTVSAGEQEVRRADSALWPSIDSALTGLAIDEDRAAASFGSQPERSLGGSVGLSQLLFSDAALANRAIQRSLQEGRRWQLETLRLDIALEAGTAYLNLLRAQSLLQVQRNNVDLTRSNLELARVRRSIGAANPAEVYRWESQIAIDRKALVEAESAVRVAQIAVNRLLHQPLEERFITEEVDLERPWRVTGDPRFAGFIETPAHFRAFRDFMVAEGVLDAPELTVLSSAIEAQERAVTTARRAFWAPVVGLQASLDELLSKSGEGSAAPALPVGGLFPAVDDTAWSVAVRASLPLFTGFARKADEIQAEQELKSLRLEYGSTVEKIQQRIRSALEVARASRTGIRLAREAAEAARKNLELVTDAYARGAIPILDLLDAQNAALNAEELAANSVYDFLIDLLQVERAANRFEILGTEASKEAFFQRLEKHFSEQGISPLRAPDVR